MKKFVVAMFLGLTLLSSGLTLLGCGIIKT